MPGLMEPVSLDISVPAYLHNAIFLRNVDR
jgi:hypothetical protein